MRAGAEFRAVGVAGDEADALVLDPEPFAEQLGIAGLVPLPARQRADLDLDHAFAAAPSTTASSSGAPLCDST